MLQSMTLAELKSRITTTADDSALQVKLEDAIDFCCGYLNQSFTDAYGDNPMPSRVKKVVAKHVQSELAFANKTGIKSQSLAGMSQTFDSASERDKALQGELLATGLRKLRW